MNANSADVTLELNLLDNGIDFILRGIDELFDDSHTLKGYSDPVDVSLNSYKYGTLHLFSGFLLLLKERLSRHLPELIFKGKIGEVREKLAHDKTPFTVDLEEALERLEIGPKVTFTDDELKTIKGMQDIRNQFEHYRVSRNKYQLWDTLSRFLALIDRFLVQELKINIEATADSTRLRDKIQSIEVLWERINKQRKEEWRREAQRRLEEFEQRPEEIVAELESEKYSSKGDIVPFIFCPECGEETLIAYGEYAGICINKGCYSIRPLTECVKCGQLTEGFPWEFNACESCQDWLDHEDDMYKARSWK
jgi:hypothetical protein